MNALEESIKKWESIASGENKEFPSTSNCALCYEYKDKFTDSCFRCPVYKRTKKNGCINTPYSNAIEARDIFGPHSTKYLAAAQLEVEFLKSLR